MGPNEDLEVQRRSLAMLPPGAATNLKREDALSLIEELQVTRRRVVELERELHDAAIGRHPAGGGTGR